MKSFLHTHMCTHMHMHTRKTEMRAVRTMIISKQTKKGKKRERKIARARALLKVNTCVCNEHLPETKMKKKIGIPLCRMHFVHKIAVTLEHTAKQRHSGDWLYLYSRLVVCLSAAVLSMHTCRCTCSLVPRPLPPEERPFT